MVSLSLAVWARHARQLTGEHLEENAVVIDELLENARPVDIVQMLDVEDDLHVVRFIAVSLNGLAHERKGDAVSEKGLFDGRPARVLLDAHERRHDEELVVGIQQRILLVAIEQLGNGVESIENDGRRGRKRPDLFGESTRHALVFELVNDQLWHANGRALEIVRRELDRVDVLAFA